MAGESETWRDWHHLFGLLLTDFFTDGHGSELQDVVSRHRARGILIADGDDVGTANDAAGVFSVVRACPRHDFAPRNDPAAGGTNS